jgi:SAM-dependent methyltransferase
MHLNPYLHYFLYVAWHWNPLFATVITIHEIRGDRHYRIRTTGEDELKGLEKSGIDISHATLYMPSSYNVLEKLMKEITKYPSNKTFLDIGCGKGRAMVVAAEYGFTRIKGIDFSKEFCDYAGEVTKAYHSRNPSAEFTVIHAEASSYAIDPDITTIFLFNPFDEIITARLVENIQTSQSRNPRTIRVLYVNPIHKSSFLEKGFVEIYHFKSLHYFEGSILESL